jgi:hypothetical protein
MEASARWTAKEETNIAGADRKLTVEGPIQVSSIGATANLLRHEPQGFNPTILLLDLVIEGAEGQSGGAMAPRVVRYAESISDGAYKEVQVLLDANAYQTIQVEKVLS